jgi:hypothetical protein
MKQETKTRAPPGRKAVWIDVGLAAVTGGTASIADVDIVADEIP